MTLLKLALALNEMLVKLPLEQTQFKVVEEQAFANMASQHFALQ